MSVAAHLGINLAEYDARIRTFIPYYEEMLDVAAAAVPRDARTIVDLGTGTGALAARCLGVAPKARVIGIDADPDILKVAARRLGRRAEMRPGSFLRAELPRADAVVASFALHHVRTRGAKQRLYARIARALRRGGRMITVDCQPAANRPTAAAQMAAWTEHLRRSYSRREAVRLLAAWSREDVYVPFDAEIEMMRASGLAVDVLWRRDAFAVLMGVRP
jgi:ubiquinone/menaquinone biosynthesis C-methylase UbiE